MGDDHSGIEEQSGHAHVSMASDFRRRFEVEALFSSPILALAQTTCIYGEGNPFRTRLFPTCAL